MDRCLTAASVSRFAQAVLDSTEPVQAEQIYEGGDHQSWFIDDDFVMRFAPDEDGSIRLLREIEVRELIRASGSPPIPLPRSVATGRWGSNQHLSFTLDQRIHGTSMEVTSITVTTERDLVTLLRNMRTVPIIDAVLAGVPYQPDCNLNLLRQNANDAFLRLTSRAQLQETEEECRLILKSANIPNFSCASDTEDGKQVPPTLIHADLKGEHILLDMHESGHIVGILDWTDTLIGDPATDISGLCISVGARMAVRIAKTAGYTLAVAARGVFLARCHTLMLLDDRLNGADDDSPEDLLRTQLKRAFEDAELNSPTDQQSVGLVSPS